MNKKNEVIKYLSLVLAIFIFTTAGIKVTNPQKNNEEPKKATEVTSVPIPTKVAEVLVSPTAALTDTPSPTAVEEPSPTTDQVIPTEQEIMATNPVEPTDIPVEPTDIPEEGIDNLDHFFYIYPNNHNEVCTYINVNSDKQILLVGDSRTVGFYLATGYEEFSYIAKGSMGYNWLVNGTDAYNPSTLIDKYLAANPSGKVVMCLGINDLGNLPKYYQWVVDFVKTHPNANLYYMSVNSVTNRPDLVSGIIDFNVYMPEHIPESVTWLNCIEYLEEVGFYAGDGVHYDVATYNKILQFILENV